MMMAFYGWRFRTKSATHSGSNRTGDSDHYWKRSDAHSDGGQGAMHFGKICDTIFYYAKSAGQQVLNCSSHCYPKLQLQSGTGI